MDTQAAMPGHIHYKEHFPNAIGFNALLAQAMKIQTTSWENLSKTSTSASNVPRNFKGYQEVCETMLDFKCDRCGMSFGNVLTWDNSRALVIDTLTGLGDLIFYSIVGESTGVTLPQIGHAQRVVKDFIQNLISSKSHLVILSHLDKSVDEITGRMVINPKTVGNKLGPIIPTMLQESYHAVRDGQNFHWLLNSTGVLTKSRLFGVKLDRMQQNFSTVLATNKKLKTGVGLKAIIQGDSGSGKSFSIGTLVQAGLDVFVLMTEETRSVYHQFDKETKDKNTT